MLDDRGENVRMIEQISIEPARFGARYSGNFDPLTTTSRQEEISSD